MANKQLSEVTEAGALDGTELMLLLQDSNSRRLLLSALLSWMLDEASTAEKIRDVIGAALVAGTSMSIVADDGANTITIGFSLAALQEIVRDAIGVALVAGESIGITVDDGADTITIGVSKRGTSFQIVGTAPTADEPLLAWTPANGETVTFADDFAGSTFKKTSTGTDPAGDYVMPVKKSGADVGSITISAAGAVTFVTTGGTVEIIGGTDILEVFGSATPDAGAVGYTFTLIGTLS